MARYEVHRQDATAADMIRFFRAHGLTYVALDRPVDGAVCSPEGRVAFVEFKSRTGKLRPSQLDFLDTWPGAWALIRSEKDARTLVDLLRRRTR